VSDDGHTASPEQRAVMRRFWRRVIVVMVIQTIVIVAAVKLLPEF
jgi:hypothetical protein